MYRQFPGMLCKNECIILMRLERCEEESDWETGPQGVSLCKVVNRMVVTIGLQG